MTEKNFYKYYDMPITDLLHHLGLSLDEAVRLAEAGKVIGPLVRWNLSDGIGWRIKTALVALAHTRDSLPVKVGDRVTVNDPTASAERWARRGMESMVATFSERGTVRNVDFNAVWGYWHADVEFDREYYVHFSTKELTEVNSKHHWAFKPTSLTVVNTIDADEPLESRIPKPTLTEPPVGSIVEVKGKRYARMQTYPDGWYEVGKMGTPVYWHFMQDDAVIEYLPSES